MILEDYGWDSWFDDQYKSLNMHLKTGRVVGNTEKYRVVCEEGIIDAGISHRLLYSTASDSELPVPGDWVLIISDESDSGYSIYDLLPRRSFLALYDDENPEEFIPAAANVDYVLAAIPAGTGLDPSIVENLTSICRDWGAEPIFICYGKSSGKKEQENFKKAAGDAGIIFIDSIDKDGLQKLNTAMAPRKTYAVTGVNTDDVSAIISYLTDGEIFENSTVKSNAPDYNMEQGVLHLLPSSAILLGIPIPGDTGFFAGDYDGNEFGDLAEIANLCRFNDCRHINEPGCAVLEAVDNGEIDYDYYKEFMKELKKETVRVSSAEQSDVKKLKKSLTEKSERVTGE